MTRITFLMPSELKATARKMAAERGMSLSAWIREAAEEWMERHDATGAPQPKPRSVGVGNSGLTDGSRLAGEIRPEPRSWRD
jgi:hypothetical protein